MQWRDESKDECSLFNTPCQERSSHYDPTVRQLATGPLSLPLVIRTLK